MSRPIRKWIESIKNAIMHMSFLKLTIFVLVLIGLLAGIGITVTAQPGFCNSCHVMNDYYESWEKSAHHDVSCLSCHLEPGFTNYLVGKIKGLSQSIDCMVGRVGTKASATVQDASCLRSPCHSTEELVDKTIDFNGKKFTHDKHIDKVIDGINVTCGTCHSHFEGKEHFSVNPQACFSCHFLKSEHTPEKLAHTNCLNCHEVPNKVIKRGFVEINHLEFVSYQASCEDSCHKGQVEVQSNVNDMMCLNCHDFGMEEGVTSEELHHAHSGHEKVECFACHGQISHGPSKTNTVASMSTCENCHSDTHGVQKSIFGAEHHPAKTDDDKILSPMFLTHVECSDCHVKPAVALPGVLNSIGTVAKASTKACDKCHEPGTGDQYVPFWQKRIKKLYQAVSDKVERKEYKLNSLPESKRNQVQKSIDQARAILESIKADGSWGVHNLKYTEALLLKADTIITLEK
jgi:nitrate/TMAO reductase-like tetraheme cytochrome c subunit